MPATTSRIRRGFVNGAKASRATGCGTLIVDLPARDALDLVDERAQLVRRLGKRVRQRQRDGLRRALAAGAIVRRAAAARGRDQEREDRSDTARPGRRDWARVPFARRTRVYARRQRPTIGATPELVRQDQGNPRPNDRLPRVDALERS